MLARAPSAQQQALRDYGKHLGIAFQLVDDALDYSAESEQLGKNVGDDLAEGKPTLPLIYAMEKGSAAQRDMIRDAIEKGSAEKFDQIHQAIEECGALDYTMAQAQENSDRAKHALDAIKASEFKQALQFTA